MTAFPSKLLSYIMAYNSTARLSRPPKFSPQIEEKMEDPRISRSNFSGLIWKFILWHATKRPWDSSIRLGIELSRLFPPALVFRSNQAATVCLRPSYRSVTGSLLYRPHRRTDIWIIMIKLVCARSSHVCRHPAQPPDHLPISYYLEDTACLPPRRPSICPYAHLTVAALVAIRPHLRRSPVLSASPVDRPFAGTRSLLRFPPRRSCCSHGLASTSAVATLARALLW